MRLVLLVFHIGRWKSRSQPASLLLQQQKTKSRLLSFPFDALSALHRPKLFSAFGPGADFQRRRWSGPEKVILSAGFSVFFSLGRVGSGPALIYIRIVYPSPARSRLGLALISATGDGALSRPVRIYSVHRKLAL